MCADQTSVAVQHYRNESAAGSPDEPIIRALPGRAVGRLHRL